MSLVTPPFNEWASIAVGDGSEVKFYKNLESDVVFLIQAESPTDANAGNKALGEGLVNSLFVDNGLSLWVKCSEAGQSIKILDGFGGAGSGSSEATTGLVFFENTSWIKYAANGRLNWNVVANNGAEPDVTIMSPLFSSASVSEALITLSVSTAIAQQTQACVSFEDRVTGSDFHVISDIDLTSPNSTARLDVDLSSYSPANDFDVYLSFRSVVAPPSTVSMPFSVTIR